MLYTHIKMVHSLHPARLIGSKKNKKRIKVVNDTVDEISWQIEFLLCIVDCFYRWIFYCCHHLYIFLHLMVSGLILGFNFFALILSLLFSFLSYNYIFSIICWQFGFVSYFFFFLLMFIYYYTHKCIHWYLFVTKLFFCWSRCIIYKIYLTILNLLYISYKIIVANYYIDPLFISVFNKLLSFYLWFILFLIRFYTCILKTILYDTFGWKKIHIKVHRVDLEWNFWYSSKTTLFDLVLHIKKKMNEWKYDDDYCITHPEINLNNHKIFNQQICHTKLAKLPGILIFPYYTKSGHKNNSNISSSNSLDNYNSNLLTFNDFINVCNEIKEDDDNIFYLEDYYPICDEQCAQKWNQTEMKRVFVNDTNISGIYDHTHVNKPDSQLIRKPLLNLHETNVLNFIKIKIYSSNVIHYYPFCKSNTIGHLHDFTQRLLKIYGIYENYSICHTNKNNQVSSRYLIFNHENKFHMSFEEIGYQKDNNALLIVPNHFSKVVCGGGQYGNSKSRLSRSKRTRKQSRSYWEIHGSKYNSKRKSKSNIQKSNIQKSISIKKQKKDKKKKKRTRNKKYRSKLGKLHNKFRFDIENFDEDNILYTEHDAGLMNKECNECCALMFEDESLLNKKKQYALCCQKGQISLPKLNEMPQELVDLLVKNDRRGKFFRKHIRKFNSALAFASFGINSDKNTHLKKKLNDPKWGSLKVNGHICHQMNESFVNTNEPTFASIYFYSGSDSKEVENRLKFSNLEDSKLSREILEILQKIIHDLNPFYKQFKNAIELQQQKPLQRLQIVLKAGITPDGKHKGCYNLPTSLEQVAAIIPGHNMEQKHRDIMLLLKDDTDDKVVKDVKKKNKKIINKKKKKTRDLIINVKNNTDDTDWYDKAHSQRRKVFINEGHVMYDPATYVLMFPNGRYGWGPNCYLKNKKDGVDADIKQNEEDLAELIGYVDGIDADHEKNQRIKGKYVNCRKYYKYYMMIRNKSKALLHRFGALWQQKIIDDWCKVESNDLRYYITNKDKFRICYAHELLDAIQEDTADTAGSALYLGPAFTCGPRWYHNKYQDAMTIVQNYKKPDLFITFTTNRDWAEIKSNLFENQTFVDRPDLVSRVFQIKKEALLKDLTKNHVLGHTIAHVHTIEFQKRGLPHIHILIILSNDDSIKTSEDIDSVTCAEIPDAKKHPKLYDMVIKNMIHFHVSCIENGVCTKHFPKDYQCRTSIVEDGYPLYRRRHPEQVCNMIFIFMLCIMIFIW